MRRASNSSGAGTRSERGIAAVELAVIVTLAMCIIPIVFLFGRVLYHYSVFKQATQDAAMFMASIPAVEMKTNAAANNAAARAESMIRSAVAESGIRPDASLGILVACNENVPCGTGAPENVLVTATYALDVSLFSGFLTDWISEDGKWTFVVRSVVPYAN